MKKPEILAPAGSFEGLRAAVAAGADAVYIGGNRFGARAYAKNPDEAAMLEAIEYCHLHGRKIYLTVNTLVKNDELEKDFIPYLLPYYKAGLDAVIVQDVGAMAEIHSCFPDLNIHASTQMSLTTGYGVHLLREYGVTRLVPARELTLRELCEMRKATDREIEVFVHGALCYCYSGQCLLSSMRGERSGNRGRCAQPCRLPYKNEGKIGDYILSPKELCALEHIPKLAEAGVDSFKIEGRMKKPVYAALTTALYRRYVDLYVELGKEDYAEYIKSNEKQLKEDMGKLLELYNRNGFTAGYLDGGSGDMCRDYQKRGDMLSARRPKHGGVHVGDVIRVQKNNVASVRLCRDIDKQDVLEFRDGEGNSLYEYTAGNAAEKGERIQARFLEGSRIYTGALLYRTRKSDMIAGLEEAYLKKVPVPISGTVVLKKGKPMEFTLHKKERDSSGKEGREITVTVYGECADEAQKHPTDREQVQKQMGKIGETDFIWESLDVECEDGCFVPVGRLNDLRRAGIRQLYEKIAAAHKRSAEVLQQTEKKTASEGKTEQNQNPEITAQIHTKEQLEAVLACAAVKHVYINMEDCSLPQCAEMARQAAASGKAAYILLPHICRLETYRQLERQLQDKGSLWHQDEVAGCVMKNMEELELFSSYRKALGEKFIFIADHNLYTWNRSAKAFWYSRGIDRMTAPLELTHTELAELDITDMELMVYGHIPVMVSAQCIFRNLYECQKHSEENHSSGRRKTSPFIFTDDKGHACRVEKHCRYCYNTIYDRETYSLLGEKEQLGKLRPKSIRLAFTWENKEETEKALELLENLNVRDEKHITGHFYKKIL